jgi:type I restriction enzyme, S subunit
MKEVILGDHVKILSGFAFKSQEFGLNGKLPVVRIRDVKRGFSETFYSGDYDDKYLINNGDLLVGMDGEFNAGIWQGGKALLNQRVCKIETTEKLNFNYLKFILPIELKKIENKTSFVTVKHLSVKNIKDIDILLPPLEEQKRIAAILDKADRVRRKRQEAIRLTEELGRSIFLDMFGDPVTNPKGWEVVSMKSIVKQTQYGTSEKSNTEQKGIPVLRMNNLTYKGDLDLHDLKWCEISEKDYEKYTVKKGDLLFNRTNSPELVGKTAVWNISDEYAFAGYLVRVRFNESKANSEYVSAYLNSSHGKKYLLSKAKASINMSNFSASEFVKIPILLPPIVLQDKFKLIKEEITYKKTKVEEFNFESENLFNSLLQRAFRGEL